MTFEEWFDRDCQCGEACERRNVSIKDYARGIWDTATEEVKKDHFKIGDEVDILPEIRARVKAKAKDGTWYTYNPADVRRIPAWEPKDGEAVFYLAGGTIRVGKIMAAIGINGHTAVRGASGVDASVRNIDIKPFDPDKIGKPWDEV